MCVPLPALGVCARGVSAARGALVRGSEREVAGELGAGWEPGRALGAGRGAVRVRVCVREERGEGVWQVYTPVSVAGCLCVCVCVCHWGVGYRSGVRVEERAAFVCGERGARWCVLQERGVCASECVSGVCVPAP